MRRKHFYLWLGSLIGLLSLLTSPSFSLEVAQAHSADEYLQASYLTIAPEQVIVELNLTPGALVAPQILSQLDVDNNQTISSEEGQAYAQLVLQNIRLEIAGQAQTLHITQLEIPTYLNLQAGYGTLRIFANASLAAGLSGTQQLYYQNNYQMAAIRNLYQVNAFADKNNLVTLGSPQRDSLQKSLNLSYILPDATVSIIVGSPATGQISASGIVVSSSVQPKPEQISQSQLLSTLAAPTLTPWLGILAAGLALLLGGLHALTPGHGKTLVAAYLVGSRGTVRHAIFLGGVITFTHTISVIAVGVVALLASQFLLPGVLLPGLEIISGLLVAGLGLGLLWARWKNKNNAAVHSHAHSHPASATLKTRDLWLLGISGGLIPCPEALGILLVAVGLNQLGLGLLLIVAFSLGVALVLITVGVLLVQSRSLLEHVTRRGKRWQVWLPVVSALVVSGLGIGIVVKGLSGLPDQFRGWLFLGLLIIGASFLAFGFYRYSWSRLKVTLATAPQNSPANRSPRRKVSNAPMTAAPLRYTPDGEVAWDEMWTDFCDLALEGGPPHRGQLLEAVSAEEVLTNPTSYARVQAELERGLRLVTGLAVVRDVAPGWIGLKCTDAVMASWLKQAIIAENVLTRQEGDLLLLPAGPAFRLEKEIKNVITAAAKTHHYWTEHAFSA